MAASIMAFRADVQLLRLGLWRGVGRYYSRKPQQDKGEQHRAIESLTKVGAHLDGQNPRDPETYSNQLKQMATPM